MSGYDGNGNFTFTYSWVNDSANGIPITASRMDTQFANATSGFDLVICRDGQSTITANIPFAGFKLTGVGSPTTAGDALIYGTTAANDVKINAGKPAFLAVRTTNDANATGAGGVAAVGFPSEVFDNGSNFASSTFTAPVTGVYQFDVGVTVGDLTALMTAIDLQLVTTARSYTSSVVRTPSAGGQDYISISTLADMSAGDTAAVQMTVSGGAANTADIIGTVGGNNTRFSGALVQ